MWKSLVAAGWYTLARFLQLEYFRKEMVRYDTPAVDPHCEALLVHPRYKCDAWNAYVMYHSKKLLGVVARWLSKCATLLYQMFVGEGRKRAFGAH